MRPRTRSLVQFPPGTLAVGDLHLDTEDHDRVDRVVEWLAAQARRPRLIILGDLFEVWVGPAQARRPGAARVLRAMLELVEAGCAVDVVPGNRDFLLEERFEAASGAVVHPAGLVGELADGSRVLAIHGDELCTLDLGYQRLRRVLRSRPATFLAPRLPAPMALSIARRLRRASIRAVERKPSESKAMQPDACRAFARAEECGTVLCGHAHESRDERLADGPRWLVVDAFGGARDAVEVGADGALEVASSR